MDFGALLHYAKKNNDAATKEEGKYYSTKYAPPKKESKESKQLSSNIQKFLKKREAEEAERKRQEREKLNSLLAMRDEKSKNKIRKMLKVTKSANKSVLEDAKDCDNMALGAGEQPEGDDYGYVSTEANALYQKYIEKVKDVQEDKGFAPSRPQSVRDLSGTKERVKAAITREREEAKTHTRQRISHGSTPRSTDKEPQVARAYGTADKKLYDPDAERRDEERKKREEEQKKAKVKRPAQPPPMDFQALLRLAEKKQHEPVNIAMPEKKKEPERLLSAREKREQEERQRWKEQRAERERMRETEAKAKEQRKENGNSQQRVMAPNGRIPKLNKAPPAKAPAGAAIPSSASESKTKPTSDSLKRPASTAPSSSSAKLSASTKPASGSGSGSSSNAAKRPPAASSGTRPVSAGAAAGAAASASASAGANAKPSGSLQSRNPYASVNKNGGTREFPPRDASKTRAFPPADVQRPTNRRPLPVDARGRGGAPATGRKPAEPGNKRRIYDDDSEYDSELDDFIDDGDCEEDISSHIRDIFGYDKRRYRDLDEDDAQMESSFAQVQREEFISKKLGLQEDLEDMRMEAMHKKRKMAKKRPTRIDD
ncbi:protein SPT2 homolog isoform X2 [Drosophila novamexicana]|uniref:protein SPT2 homolog isoform X2 n=1 Tax=Drosophila novamexicana TaxID=47314 RepID=UPI0011E601D1|nr:protein SPT2 homolog isoform X2 [Drosophila novamexicana]